MHKTLNLYGKKIFEHEPISSEMITPIKEFDHQIIC
jgi:hypothetical protein